MFNKIARWFRRPPDRSGHLYYARLKTPQGVFYKLGFTSKTSLFERMAFPGLGDESLIDKELLFAYRANAYEIEQVLHEHFKSKRAFKAKFSNNPDMPLAGRGQTELFFDDVLGLDDDLYQLETGLSAEKAAALKDQEEGCLLMAVALVLAPFTLGLSMLLLLIGGSAFWKKNTQDMVRRPQPVRPTHPPAISSLIEALQKDCLLTSRPAKAALCT